MIPYLTSFRLQNIQSHEDVTIEIAPPGQMTVIQGDSNHGKSVFERAWDWLFKNDAPPWQQFLRHGCEFARSSGTYSDETVLIRERGKSYNRYKILRPGEPPKILEGFGTDVPVEVQDVTGLRPVMIGDMKFWLNFSSQHDPYFLGSMSTTAPARAKILGKLAGTEEVDHAAKGLATDLHRRKQDERRLVDDLKGLDDRISEYDYLPGMAAKIERLEQVVARVKVLQERREWLISKKEALWVVDGKISEAETIIEKWQKLGAIECLISIAEAKQARHKKLTDLRLRLSQAETGIAKAEEIINRWHGLERVEIIIAKTEKAMARKTSLERMARVLKTAQDGIRYAEGTLSKWQNLDRVFIATEKAGKLLERQVKLNSSRVKLVETSKNIADMEAKINRLSGVDRVIDLISEAEGKLMQFKSLTTIKAKLIAIDKSVQDAHDKAFYWEQRVSELEGAYRDKLVAAGQCPLCGGQIEPERLKEVV